MVSELLTSANFDLCTVLSEGLKYHFPMQSCRSFLTYICKNLNPHGHLPKLKVSYILAVVCDDRFNKLSWENILPENSILF